MNSNPIITGIAPSYTIPKDGALRLKPVVTDADGDLLTFYPTKPAQGVVLQPKGPGDPATVYLPADGYTGPDNFLVIVVDGKGGMARQTVSVNVTATAPAQVVETLPTTLVVNGVSYGRK